jgi:hypothetical protein
MKATYFWIALPFLLVALLLPYLAGRRVRTPTATTVSRIAEILTDWDLLGQETQQLTRLGTNGVLDPLQINRNVATLFATSADKDITATRLISADGLFHDAWGTPLLFMPTNSPSYEHLNPELKDRPRPFVVWSVGRNKTNEFGKGDDVFSYR